MKLQHTVSSPVGVGRLMYVGDSDLQSMITSKTTRKLAGAAAIALSMVVPKKYRAAAKYLGWTLIVTAILSPDSE